MRKNNKKKSIFVRRVQVAKTRLRKKGDKYSIQGRQRVLKYLQNQLESSTTHGLPYFLRNRLHYLERIFWIVSFVASLTLAALLLNLQYLRFILLLSPYLAGGLAITATCIFAPDTVAQSLDAPTVMSVEMNYFDWNISYPAITLCPLYKPNIDNFQAFIKETNNRTGLKVDGYMWAISQCSMDILEYLELDPSDEVNSLFDPKDYATVAASMFRKFDKGWLSTNTNLSVTVEPAMTEMGMCHVINSNVALYDDPLKWKTGATNLPYEKRNIELSIFEANFFTQIKNYTTVFKIFIHSPDEITTSTTSYFGLDVQGILTFGLSVWSSRISDELRHTSLHIRKCRFINEPISERYPIYSHSHCILECRLKMIKKLCGCVPHFFKPLKHERICYLSELKCVLEYRKEIITLETSKETLRKFHNDKDLPRISLDCGCLSTCDLDMYYKDHEDYEPRVGFNKIIVKITSFPKVRVVRDIIFSFYDMILRSGGVINLCIGSSIISIMECLITILKFFYHIVVYIFYQFKILISF